MTKLLQHIDEMRQRLTDIASDEKMLIKAIGDALNRLDQQLLRDVRSIAHEHEARREEILGELQGLAAGIGMFRAPLPNGHAQEELPRYVPEETMQPSIAPGDWREATRNIEDDIEYHLNGGMNGSVSSH
jgi:hypothetical protein